MLTIITIGYPAGGYCFKTEADLWASLRNGSSFVLLRHAIAPGTGDPEQFELAECMTQRNLSNAGRDQAIAIGARFRENNIQQVRVFSSQWCRCLETADLLRLGPVEELPLLNSFFQHFQRAGLQSRKLQEWLSMQDLSRPLVLVTHQVNITSLTDFYPASGELVFVKWLESGEISYLGSIKTN